MGAIVGAALFLALPQLAGWIATRVTQRSSWVPWPAAAITVFSALWYVLAWLPGSSVRRKPPSRTVGCGWSLRCPHWLPGS